MPRPTDDDAPRWEPIPSEAGSRWGASGEVPRWEPPPGRRTPGVRRASRAASVRRAAKRPVSALARPFIWWAARPWIVVWALVVFAPIGALVLRLVDESNHEAFVPPLGWTFGALFIVALAVAAVASLGRSPVRMAVGIVGALAAGALGLWPVTHVTLGRTECPARVGPDRGTQAATAALEAWREGRAVDDRWLAGRADPAWYQRAGGLTLLDYQLVQLGCWERMAPVNAHSTWHEFRVTVTDTDRTTLSKIVIVHTAAGAEGWKITEVEGPLP